jgi:sec-independent protein translocase protein TatC
VVNDQWMRKSRRFVIVAIFIIAAILTPPDAFSQIMMAIPLLLLYELSIFIVAVWGRPKNKAEG